MATRRATARWACVMAASFSTGLSAAAPLRCAVEAPSQVASGQPVWLRFTLANIGPKALQVLRWNTPWEGQWFAPFVAVAVDGRALRYAGPVMKRAEPGAEDYLRLEAGASTTALVDLALPFQLGQPGTYRVTPRVRLMDVFDAATSAPPMPRERHAAMDLPCALVTFTVVTPR